MSAPLRDLLAADAQLDQISARELNDADDLVLDALAKLAGAIDERVLPPFDGTPCQPVRTPHKGSWALAVTVALMITSSGVAAAVSDDPLAPLHFVANEIWDVGTPDDAQLPGWELDGSLPISTVPDSVAVRSVSGSTAAPSSRTTTSRRAHPAGRDASEPMGAASPVAAIMAGTGGGDGDKGHGNGDGDKGHGNGDNGGGRYGHDSAHLAGHHRPGRGTGHGHGPSSPPDNGQGDLPGSGTGPDAFDPVSPPQPLDPSKRDRPSRSGHGSRDASSPSGAGHGLVSTPPPPAFPLPSPTSTPAQPASTGPAPSPAAPASSIE